MTFRPLSRWRNGSSTGWTTLGSAKDGFYGDGSACVIMQLIFVLLLFFMFPPTVRAQASFSLSMPVACELGKTCWLVNYPDTDRTENSAKDFTCGPLSYDTHDGTDFGIRDLVAMKTGVPVRAAAAGTVARYRDGVEDRMPSKDDIKIMLAAKKGCGNGVVLDHRNGWQTLYCHMKKNSLAVKAGQTVKQGDQLGLVGHSGIAEFPHLHFAVFKDGNVIDPFSGQGLDKPCGTIREILWSPPLAYEPVSIYAAGFQSGTPSIENLSIDASSPDTLHRGDSKALVFWIMIYGAAAGDRIHLDIIGPGDAVVVRRDTVQDKTRARQFYYVGQKFGEALAPPGHYTGVVTLSRTDTDGKTLIRTREVNVTVR